MALLDNVRHCGEIFAIKASWDRHVHVPVLSERIRIREMVESDCSVIADAFTPQGWDKPVSQYLRYWLESRDGKRVVLLAEHEGEFAGYVTIVWESDYPPFLEAGIPEIVDFNVLVKFRRLKIGTALMDEAERRIVLRSPIAGLGVCMHVGYGPAQRLYARRGYAPDGRGIFNHGDYPDYGVQVKIDDDLGLYLTKQLR